MMSLAHPPARGRKPLLLKNDQKVASPASQRATMAMIAARSEQQRSWQKPLLARLAPRLFAY